MMSPIEYLQSQNVLHFLVISVLMFLFSFPSGLAIVNLFFKKLEARVKFFLSFAFGLIFLVGFWSILVLLKVPINYIIFIGAYFVLTALLFILLRRREGRIIDKKTFNIKHRDFILPLIIFLVSYFFFTCFYIDNVVPPHQDAQLHGFIEMFMKNEGSYPVIHPYRDGSEYRFLYPPGYHVFIAILAQLTDIPIPVLIMIVSTLCLSLMSVVLYEIAYYLTGNRYVALFAGILSANRSSFYLINTSQTTEMMGLLAIAVFLFSLFYSLSEGKSFVLPGIYMGIAGLIHSRFFLWIGSAVVVFLVILPLAKDKKIKADYKSLLAVLIVAFLTILLWLVDQLNIINPTEGRLYWHNYAYIGDIPTYWGWFILPLAIIGAAVICFRRRKCEIFLLAWIISSLVLIRYWSFLALFKVNWFEAKDSYYLDPFSFMSPEMVPYYAFNFALPLMAAYSFKLVTDLARVEKPAWVSKFSLLKSDTIARFATKHLPAITGILLGVFLYVEVNCPRTQEPHGQQIQRSDIEALTWLKDHTKFENTLVLNPNTLANWGNWAPVVSERKSVFFRSGKHYFTGQTPDFGIDWEEADWAFHHINEPKARDIIKKYQITHIYIPGQFHTRKEKDKYKIYEKYAESPYVKKVFSSIQNDSPAYIFKAEIYEVIE